MKLKYIYRNKAIAKDDEIDIPEDAIALRLLLPISKNESTRIIYLEPTEQTSRYMDAVDDIETVIL